MVGSALYRMWVYEQAYGFTRLRLVVSAFELWLGVLFLLVLVSGIQLRTGWLPRAAVGTGLVVLLGLAVLNPDRFIASHNLDRYQETGRIDVSYLSELSADAVPELNRLRSGSTLRNCALWIINSDLIAEPDGFWEFNAARSEARALLRDNRPAVCGARD